LLAEQEAGTCIFHVLISDDDTVLGLFNLRDLEHGSAVLGYRVAQDVAGRGVATATVRELCQFAAEQYGLHTLRAATNLDNIASQRVLTKAGFAPDGPADPSVVGGRPGIWYLRHLAFQSRLHGTWDEQACQRRMTAKNAPPLSPARGWSRIPTSTR
jgi:ribosomal-protein-alanine N-acetyltransferase